MSLLFKFRPLVVNPQLAERIGLNEAIVLQQLKYWLSETGAGVEHAGRRWIYNSVEQWQQQFPFWSVDTVKRALKSLQSQGIVFVEQLAKSRHDHTNHYAINYESSALIDQGNLHQSDQGNLHQSEGASCIDLTKTTTETTQEITKPTGSEGLEEGFAQFWSRYPKKVQRKDALKAWTKLKPSADLFAQIMTALGNQMASHDWLKENGRYIPNGATWINGERWLDEVNKGGAGTRRSGFTDLPQHTADQYGEGNAW